MDQNVIIQNTSPAVRVSVIIAAHNVQDFIGAAILSIQHQTYKKWELIVVDDGSIDSTYKLVQDFQKKDPRIKLFKLKKKSGQAIARNKAIENAAGEYLAILDADDVALQTRLEKQVLFLDEHKDIAAVGSLVDIIDVTGKIIGTKGKPEFPYQICFPLLLQTQFVHSSVTMRKEVFQKIGGYDTNFLYAEDFDIWSRINSAGYQLANIQEPLAQYRVQPQSVTMIRTSQLEQAERALRVNERNISPFLATPRENLVKLVNFANNQPQSFNDTRKAISLYKQLVEAYIQKKENLFKEEPHYLRQLYREKRDHALKVLIKRILKI